MTNQCSGLIGNERHLSSESPSFTFWVVLDFHAFLLISWSKCVITLFVIFRQLPVFTVFSHLRSNTCCFLSMIWGCDQNHKFQLQPNWLELYASVAFTARTNGPVESLIHFMHKGQGKRFKEILFGTSVSMYPQCYQHMAYKLDWSRTNKAKLSNCLPTILQTA